MKKESNFERLAAVDSVEGLSYTPDGDMVHLQFRTGDITYDLPIPVMEALKVEEYFIKVRRHLGSYIPGRNQ